MTRFSIKPGDIFCVNSGSVLAKTINLAQRIWDLDDSAEYNHAGIILNRAGMTVEALWSIRANDLFENYTGKKIIIGRHDAMDREKYMAGAHAIKCHIGKPYPAYRLILHLLPPLAKYFSIGNVVCSELTAQFLVGAGLFHYYKGVTPNFLADMIINWKGWSVIYQGVL